MDQSEQQPPEATTIDGQEVNYSQPVKKKNIKKFVLIFIVIFIIFVVAVVGLIIFSIQNFKSSDKNPLDNPIIMKAVENMPIPKITMELITLVPTEILATDVPPLSGTESPVLPTTEIKQLAQNWKTYNSSSLNFSIKYPNDFILRENPQGLGVEEISFSGPGNKDPENIPDYQILIYPKSFGKLIGQDFDVIYNLPAPSTQRLSSEGSSPQQFTKKANKTISGLRAIEYISTSDPPDPSEEEEVGYYIEFKNNVIIITTSNSNKANLDYMVSEFKYSS